MTVQVAQQRLKKERHCGLRPAISGCSVTADSKRSRIRHCGARSATGMTEWVADDGEDLRMSLLQKSENPVAVIPAQERHPRLRSGTGIQKNSVLTQKLDPRFHQDDYFCKSLIDI
jgi:hypothetical protein